jgi:hypothetical protein
MNLVQYSSVRSDEDCGICLDSMTGGDAIAHNDSDGRLIHPIHRKCIQEWLDTQVHKKCPLCRASIEISSLESLNQRVVKELKLAGGDALTGAGMAVVACLMISLSINAIMLSQNSILGNEPLVKFLLAYTRGIIVGGAVGGVVIGVIQRNF